VYPKAGVTVYYVLPTSRCLMATWGNGRHGKGSLCFIILMLCHVQLCYNSQFRSRLVTTDRVHECSVTNECDFGYVTATPACVSCKLSRIRVEETKVAYFDPEQRQELPQLLDEFSDLFNDRLGRCGVLVD